MSESIMPFIPCADCCACPEPIVQWESRSASKTKCGKAEYDPSTPPKIYTVETMSGSTTSSRCMECGEGGSSIGNGTHQTFSGNCTIDKETCAETNTKRTDFLDPVCEGSSTPSFTTILCATTNPIGGTLVSETATTRQYHYALGGFEECDPSIVATIIGETYATLSVEYTTLELLDFTLAALPAWDDDWDDTAGSYYSLTSDELTNSIREARYRIKFPLSKVGAGTCYKVQWIERFTPEDYDPEDEESPQPVDTPRCMIWGGSIPEGYDPDDNTTWPVLSEYFELAIPEENGASDVVEVVATCQGCIDGCP